MFTVKTLNSIAPVGLNQLDSQFFSLDDNAVDPQAIILRSAKMHDYSFNDALLCIARAGAGYNNIPIDVCADKGIVVFNTPGANANGVKELVICSLLLASRDIVSGIAWSNSVSGSNDIPARVEKEKSKYTGPEIAGKTLGLIGLGAIGAKVAKAAHALGMTVCGVDPYISDELRLELDGVVDMLDTNEQLFAISDYISLHLPYTGSPLIDAAAISHMKNGARIINLARGELVNDDDILSALSDARISRYVTDFPNDKTAGAMGVIAIPHLGASTPESEDNCAIMAAEQVSEYLLNGNIINSVNLPNVRLVRNTAIRILLLSKSDSSNEFYSLLRDCNIKNSAESVRNGFYAMIADVDSIPDETKVALTKIPGLVKLRIIQ